MTDDELRVNLTELAYYEDRIAWPYLDDDKPPNVTIGVGCLISSMDALVELPLQHPDGTPATDAEKAAEFRRIKSMPGGLLAAHYRGNLALSEDGIDQLGFTRLRETIVGLKRWFPGFDGFPLPARQCLLDLGWNCGTGPKLPGLGAWTHLQTACNIIPPDFQAASGQCTTTSSRETRNAWRVARFLAAAQAASSGAPESS